MGDVIQPSLFIPEDIRLGLLSGLYVRIGGVVRNAKTMALVKLLEDAGPAMGKGELAQGAIGAGRFIKKHWVVPVAVAAGAGVTAFGVWVYTKPVRDCSAKYRVALSDYLEAISSGTEVNEKVAVLLAVFEEMQLLQSKRRFTWFFPQQTFGDLRNLLSTYTDKLAEANHVEHPQLPQLESGEGDGLIDEIEQYLQAQKNILDSKGNN
jgi:hypothetical protein